MSEVPPDPQREPLPIVTEDTLKGMQGTIRENAAFFSEAELAFADRQKQLYGLIVQWAQPYGEQALEIALRTAAIMHFALMEQAASDALRRQHPDV